MFEFELELKEAKENKEKKRVLEKSLKDLKQKKEAVTQKLEELENVVEQGRKNVERLENGKMFKLYYKLLGSYDEKVRREQNEIETKEYALSQTRTEYGEVCKEYAEASGEYEKVEECDEKYQRLFEEKKEYLKRKSAQNDENNNSNDALSAMESEKELMKTEKKNISKIITKIKTLISDAKNIESNYKDAIELGRMDLFSDNYKLNREKYSAYNAVQSSAAELKAKIKKMSEEIEDIIKVRENIYTINSSLKYYDIYRDNIFMDMVALDRLNGSKAEVTKIRRELEAYVEKLKFTKVKINAEELKLEKKIEEYIVESEV